MKLISLATAKIKIIFSRFLKLSWTAKILIIIFVMFGSWFFYQKLISDKTQQIQYQQVKAEKGTIIVSIATSGQVSTANSASVTTQASGVVKNIFVESGQKVQAGDKIAELDLDMDGKQRSSQAYASYLSAKNNVDTARANLYSSQSTMLTNWQKYMDLAQNSTYQNSDGTPKTDQRQLTQFMTVNDDWLATEAKFKIQENTITQTQTSLNSSWSSYLQSSPIIYAPISGTVDGLSLQIGSVINAQSNSSGTASSQKIASIKTDASPTVTVNLTEVDVFKVKIGNKVTLTFDAIQNKTYTGKVISIDSVGAVSSGVTNYPAVIKLDVSSPEIFTNMSAQANIITQIKDNVLIVPSAAIQTQNDQSIVKYLKNGFVEQVVVETGLSSSSQTEIISGLSEGDSVITGTLTPKAERTTGQTSIFGGGSFGIFRGSGSNAVRSTNR